MVVWDIGGTDDDEVAAMLLIMAFVLGVCKLHE